MDTRALGLLGTALYNVGPLQVDLIVAHRFSAAGQSANRLPACPSYIPGGDMKQLLRILAVLLVIGLVVLPAVQAQDPSPTCDNPRSAADSLFIWQTDDQYDLTKAKSCLDVPKGANGERLAVQLKQVLDARGLYVPVDSLPTDPLARDASGEAVVIPLPESAPWLKLEAGEDGKWRYSGDTLLQTSSLYASTFSPLSRWFQSQLPPVFYNRVLGLMLWQYLYAFILVAVALLFGRAVHWFLRNQVVRIIERSRIPLDEETWARTSGPVMVIATALVFIWGLPDLQLSIRYSDGLYRFAWIVVALAGVVGISRFVDLGARIALDSADNTDSKLDDQLVPLVHQALRVVVWILGMLFVLSQTGVDVRGLIAGVSVGSLAFALAAQDSAANLFGAANIFIDKPFQIGDWVKIGDVEGTVEEVGFRSVRVRTFYNSLVTIPNSAITTSNVDNLGLRHRRRTKLVLGLTYDTPPEKMQAFVEGIRAILAGHPHVQRTYEVHFHNFGDSALEVLVYYHLITETWSEELEARSQNLIEFMRLAQALEVSFAFPSTSLYIESTPERPQAAHPAPELAELQRQIDRFAPIDGKPRTGGVAFEHSWSVPARESKGALDDVR